ncbi:MAG: UDP-N-acetylmuramoyl-L-alanyl-D-glutamate--2,6-diaminopimelate ligase [Hyphomicrobiaceae bacterium]
MKLSDLVSPEVGLPPGSDAIEIAAIAADSRDVSRGTLFAALPGSRVNGVSFISEAIDAGAAAVIAPMHVDVSRYSVPIIRANDPRRILALAAARFFGRQPQLTVAVTGTSGKTSVAEFTRQIFAELGHPAASLGTIGIIRSDGEHYGSLTTPDPVTLHRVLARLAEDGLTHLAFEASSHGLDQRRLDGVELSAAAFTNLGRDHLDYHSTMDDYLSSKLRLFDTLLPEGAGVVVNADDANAMAIAAIAARRRLALLRIGRGSTADIKLDLSQPEGFGQTINFWYGGREHSKYLDLIGAYQAINALTAAGLALAVGEAPDEVFAALEVLKCVPGRLDVVGQIHGATIVIDYAHKPDALMSALEALRPFVSGRLINVFGCGGDRDPGKREIMGQISADHADVTIVTDDNPRTEDPTVIRRSILQRAPAAQEIPDRYEAIAAAISMAAEGDVVLIAGKGHETGQIIGSETLSFSDHEAVAAILREF